MRSVKWPLDGLNSCRPYALFPSLTVMSPFLPGMSAFEYPRWGWPHLGVLPPVDTPVHVPEGG